MSVTVDQRAKGHHEVDVYVAISVPHVGTLASLQHNGAIGVNCCSTRGRVHAFDQGLLGALEQLLGARAIRGCSAR